MNIIKNKKTILILIVIIAIFFGYWFFYLSKKDVEVDADKNLKSQTKTSNTQYDKEFVSSLIGLDSVNIDISILQSKIYNTLNYPENPFVINYPMEFGRNNPFLPIGFENTNINLETQNQVIASSSINVITDTSTTTATSTVKPIPKKF